MLGLKLNHVSKRGPCSAPLTEPMLEYCQLDPEEGTPNGFITQLLRHKDTTQEKIHTYAVTMACSNDGAYQIKEIVRDWNKFISLAWLIHAN